MYETKTAGFKRNKTNMFNEIRGPRKSVPPSGVQDANSNNLVIALSDNMNIKLSILERKITELDDTYTRRMQPTFDNAELEFCDHQIRQISKEISQKIQNLYNETKRPIKTDDPDVAQLLLNLQQCHRIRLSYQVQRFRNIQATKRPEIQMKEETNDPISEMYADFNVQSNDQEHASLLQRNAEQQQQNEEISQLISMMNELNALFRDTSLLIFEQGTVLDRIDTKIEMSIQSVNHGNEELEIANQYQSSKCFYVYIFVLVVLIGICLLIMIFRKS
ncbi:syntaxin 16/TLG2-like protein [Histomonas meleagridis]|uniref:syntaxin 16/TLG2-like protein n=1 Tax=Histomonas meleagridis TaxID=135588 RepID=UPI00355988D2|nr:syntaxin 16/TLG2-like protein [Histomonas meleagridis]KAH0797431.1 syntaxin 16/TLG2-like protein [Histomonas meleagridis]